MTPTHSQKALRVHRTHLLPDDVCPTCGTTMVEARGRLRLPVNGEKVSVPAVSHLRCPKCHEVILRFEDARRLSWDAIAIYRRKHDLLSAEEIRAVRKQFGLTQGELARLLHLGANTVSRWESGRNVQTAAMDVLVRLIRDLPGSIEYLRRHAA
ncbi:MAG TPA: type II toxin-antitoxin system MqsA family antitoxin [Candidatus Baltobacteraceae bacterium]|nr:type II toxin-antitoxin system MqsA family antitoxin [Candidatus Baltobacteraceae bacterium]